MGRKLKVYPGEVEDFLKGNGTIPVGKIAENFECTTTTIRKRIAELRDEGKRILPTHKGVILVESVTEENAEPIIKAGNWIVGEVVGIARIGSVTKRPLLQVRKLRMLSQEQRAELKKSCLFITRFIDMIEIEEEFAPLQLEM